MKTDVDRINQFDSCVKKFLVRELKYRLRTMNNVRKHQISISELSYSQQSQLTYKDIYPSDAFKEKLTTRLFEAVINNELLYEALLAIKPKTRELIILKYWGNMTDKEIGQVLDMKKNAVTRHKLRALAQLKELLEEMRKHEK